MYAIQAWWLQRDTREQWILSLGSVITVLLLIYALWWQPLQQQEKQLRIQVKAQIQLHQWMRQASQQVTYLKTRQLMQKKPQGSLLYLLDKSLNNSALKEIDKRINPKDEQQVYLQFEQVSFTALLQWLVLLKSQYNIQAKEVHINRLETEGLVKAQLKLFTQ